MGLSPILITLLTLVTSCVIYTVRQVTLFIVRATSHDHFIAKKELRIKKSKPKYLKELKQYSPHKKIVRKTTEEIGVFFRKPKRQHKEAYFPQALLNLVGLSYLEVENIINKNKRFGSWKGHEVGLGIQIKILKELGYLEKGITKDKKLTMEEVYYMSGGDTFYSLSGHLVGINRDGVLIDNVDSLNMFVSHIYQKSN